MYYSDGCWSPLQPVRSPSFTTTSSTSKRNLFNSGLVSHSNGDHFITLKKATHIIIYSASQNCNNRFTKTKLFLLVTTEEPHNQFLLLGWLGSGCLTRRCALNKHMASILGCYFRLFLVRKTWSEGLWSHLLYEKKFRGDFLSTILDIFPWNVF